MQGTRTEQQSWHLKGVMFQFCLQPCCLREERWRDRKRRREYYVSRSWLMNGRPCFIFASLP